MAVLKNRTYIEINTYNEIGFFNVFPKRSLRPQACEGRSPMIGGR